MTSLSYVQFLSTLWQPAGIARQPSRKGKPVLDGDIAYILAFIVLPTAILVSSIWFIVLIRKGIMLPPRARQPAVDEANWQAAVEDDATPLAETPAITHTTAWAESDSTPPATEDPTGATLEHPAVVVEAPAVDAPSAGQPTVSTEALTEEPPPVLEEPAVAQLVPEPPIAVVAEVPEPPADPEFQGFEETRELPIVTAAPPEPEPPAAETGTPAADDEPDEMPAAAARRKPGRRLGPRASVEDEQLRPLAPVRRASARKGESLVEGDDRPVDIMAGDDEGDV